MGVGVGVGRFWEKQGRKSRKEGTFGEKVGLYFSNGVGEGGEETPSFSFSSPAKVEFRYLGRKNTSSNWFFRRKMRFRARKSRELKRKTPRKRRFLPQMRPNRTKKGGFGWEITGKGWSEKTDLTVDFAMLWSNKMGANEFFSHFFSSKSCRECGNALPLHSQSGSNALARESYALNATRQQKCCCDLWKSYITDCREVQGTIDHEAFFLLRKEVASGKMNCTVKFYS